jgi:hypothetical protein
MNQFEPMDESSGSESSSRTKSSNSSESDKSTYKKTAKSDFIESNRVRGRSRKRTLENHYPSSDSGSSS